MANVNLPAPLAFAGGECGCSYELFCGLLALPDSNRDPFYARDVPNGTFDECLRSCDGNSACNFFVYNYFGNNEFVQYQGQPASFVPSDFSSSGWSLKDSAGGENCRVACGATYTEPAAFQPSK